MNSVPTSTPAPIAMTDHSKLPPLVMLIRPTASVAICALDMNHSGPRCQSLPCRSFRGT